MHCIPLVYQRHHYENREENFNSLSNYHCDADTCQKRRHLLLVE
uniref:Uncharacterized protein n=1 Tax=Rhizophora mucronata TaxID=61149 RepID=A0A2P2P8T3_RHIMU